MAKKETDIDQVKGLLAEYYKSIPTGRALLELRFSLQKSLEKVNHALNYKDRDEMIKDKELIENRLSEINIKLEERTKEADRRRTMTKKELKALKRSVKQQ